MDPPRRQHIARTIVLMLVGVAAVLVAGGLAALRDPAFYLLGSTMLVWNVGEALALKQEEPAEYAAKRSTRLLQGSVIVAGLVGALDRWRFGFTHLPGWVVPVGALIILAGGALRVWAIRTLDAHFRYELRVVAGQRIVSSGPYRLVRHPSYLGVLVVALGEGLTLASPLGVALGVLAVLAVLVLRIQSEEQVMRASFGAAYDDYARKTWRLVPFVY